MIQASYIGDAAPGAPLELSTVITAVDLANQTFQLGGLAIDYSQPVLLQLPNGMPETGSVVEVEGVTLDAAGQLVAQRIVGLPVEPGVFAALHTDAEDASVAPVAASNTAPLGVNLMAFITSSNLPGTINVSDVEVSLDGSTIVEGGIVDDLQPGRRVQVVGEVLSVGSVQANRITIF